MSNAIDMDAYRTADHNKVSRITAAHHAGGFFIDREEKEVRTGADVPEDVSRRLARLMVLVGDLAAAIAAGAPEYEIALARIHGNVTHWLVSGQAERAR